MKKSLEDKKKAYLNALKNELKEMSYILVFLMTDKEIKTKKYFNKIIFDFSKNEQLELKTTNLKLQNKVHLCFCSLDSSSLETWNYLIQQEEKLENLENLYETLVFFIHSLKDRKNYELVSNLLEIEKLF